MADEEEPKKVIVYFGGDLTGFWIGGGLVVVPILLFVVYCWFDKFCKWTTGLF